MANEKIYTIGYEGAVPEKFLRKIQSAGIKRLLDVRAVPFSRKSGFSGEELRLLLAGAGIEYYHFPQLGIPSEFRKEGMEKEALFTLYEQVLLPRAGGAMAQAAQLCRECRTVLLCFEADPAQCHRSRLSRKIAEQFGLVENHLWMDLGMLPGF